MLLFLMSLFSLYFSSYSSYFDFLFVINLISYINIDININVSFKYQGIVEVLKGTITNFKRQLHTS